MAKENKTRWAIEVGGQMKNLISVTERQGGDLVIGFAGKQHERGLWGAEDPQRHLTGAKFSVHSSHNSPEINTLKGTIGTSDGEPMEIRAYTKAIKGTKNFEMLFSSRQPDLALQPTIKNERVDVVSIGNYDPNLYTLFYTVLVGPKGRIFALPGQMAHDTNVFQQNFGEFEVVMLWSFCAIPSAPSAAMTLTYSTHNIPNISKADLDAYQHQRIDGMNEKQCSIQFHTSRIRLQEELVTFATMQSKKGGVVANALTHLSFFLKGSGKEQIEERMATKLSYKVPSPQQVNAYVLTPGRTEPR